MSTIKMTFDPEIAKQLGTDTAIIYSNIQFWVAKNKANEKNAHEGKHWTYNSYKAFQKLFTYLTIDQIRYCLSKLEKEGFIKVDNFNKKDYDKTKWYTTTEDASDVVKFPQGCENSHRGVGNFPKGGGKIPKPIPDSKHTDSKHTDKEKNNTKKESKTNTNIPDLNSDNPNATLQLTEKEKREMEYGQMAGKQFETPDQTFSYCAYCIKQEPHLWKELKSHWGVAKISRKKSINCVKEFATWVYSRDMRAKSPRLFLPLMRKFFEGQEVREFRKV